MRGKAEERENCDQITESRKYWPEEESEMCKKDVAVEKKGM